MKLQPTFSPFSPLIPGRPCKAKHKAWKERILGYGPAASSGADEAETPASNKGTKHQFAIQLVNPAIQLVNPAV